MKNPSSPGFCAAAATLADPVAVRRLQEDRECFAIEGDQTNVYASDYPGALLGLMPTKVVQQQSNGPTLANAVKIALGDTLP